MADFKCREPSSDPSHQTGGKILMADLQSHPETRPAARLPVYIGTSSSQTACSRKDLHTQLQQCHPETLNDTLGVSLTTVHVWLSFLMEYFDSLDKWLSSFPLFFLGKQTEPLLTERVEVFVFRVGTASAGLDAECPQKPHPNIRSIEWHAQVSVWLLPESM